MLSRTLSLIPSWSGIKALLGALSEVSVVVTHRVPSPGSGFVAVQPVGNAGAVTESQFSTHGTGDPAAVAVAVGVGDDVPPGVNVAVAVAVGAGGPPGPELAGS